MPVRNEASFIEKSFCAVLHQDFPPERMQIILVDGMSDDGTLRIVERIVEPERKELLLKRPEVIIVENPARIVPQALNLGLQRARGDIVIRVDGHCEIASDYVRRCVEALDKTKADCVGGPMKTVGATWIARGIALAQSSFFGVGGAAFRTGGPRGRYVDTLAFGAYRRHVFERIGLFDESLKRNQDDEFNLRLTQSGGRIWLDPGIKSVYYSRSSLSGLMRQYFEYGFYKVAVIKKRRTVSSWRQLVPAIFVVALFTSLLAGLIAGWPWFSASVIAPYGIAALAAAAVAARREPVLFPVLPLAFATMHFAYGLGFLAGVCGCGKGALSGGISTEASKNSPG
jgi:glycosyltransferase involved in cell wall biosynthesis